MRLELLQYYYNFFLFRDSICFNIIETQIVAIFRAASGVDVARELARFDIGN